MDSLLNGWNDNLTLSVFGKEEFKDKIKLNRILLKDKLSIEYLLEEFPEAQFNIEGLCNYIVYAYPEYEYIEMLEHDDIGVKLFKGLIR